MVEDVKSCGDDEWWKRWRGVEEVKFGGEVKSGGGGEVWR